MRNKDETLVRRVCLLHYSARGATLCEYALLVAIISMAGLVGSSYLGRSAAQTLCEIAMVGQNTPAAQSDNASETEIAKNGGNQGGVAGGGSTAIMPDKDLKNVCQ